MLGSSLRRSLPAAANGLAARAKDVPRRSAGEPVVAASKPARAAALQGSLAGSGPLPVLRLLMAAGASGCLRLEREALAGYLYLEQGRIIAASCAGEQGPTALAALAVALRDCRFHFEEGAVPDQHAERMAPLDAAGLSATLDGLLDLVERLQARGLIEVVGSPPGHDGTPATRRAATGRRPVGRVLDHAPAWLRFWGRTIILALVAALLLVLTLWQRRLPPPAPGLAPPATVAQQTLPAGSSPAPTLAGQGQQRPAR